MFNATDQTIHDAHLMSRLSNQESAFLIIVPRTTDTVTHFIREHGNARHLICVCLHGQFFLRHLWRSCRPSFTIHKNSRVNLVQFRTDGIHRFNVMNTHQVETETVNMILIDPMQYRFNHVFAHHGSVAGRFIATAGCICIFTFRIEAIEIPRYSLFKITVYNVECMIVYHIKNHTYTRLVQCLHHLLEFLDTDCRVIWICGI